MYSYAQIRTYQFELWNKTCLVERNSYVWEIVSLIGIYFRFNSVEYLKRGQDQRRSHLQESSIICEDGPPTYRHLEKQSELLKEAHKTMSQELQTLQVEHEMMMRKFYELMTTHRLNQKKRVETQTQNVLEGRETVEDSLSTLTIGDEEEH
ncbi:PREDICTED: uncharacterized protein LOC109126784 isoform X1 [Camelina sativa]|uniref:Uncharacterized protein LOC109126784 isoform X1 n=1 Tax=Camelina sativa TaxID=90675 RepID=A0ABM1QH97_CAMSA|nr:PREDICTED: uncharacterized protein LOC109126784 isoform X1 [Camelina sativa]